MNSPPLFCPRSDPDKNPPSASKPSCATTPVHSEILRHGVPSPLGPGGPVCYSNHCLQYDPQRRAPLWVAEHLHRDKAFPDKVRRGEKSNDGSFAPLTPRTVI